MQKSANHRLRACLWLINLFRRYRELSLVQINQYWQEQIQLSGGESLPRRTFNDYRDYCFDLFHVSIDCDRSTNTYYIDLSDDNEVTEWLLSSFSFSSLSQQTTDVRNRILLNTPPQGMRFFDLIVEAFRAECCLEAIYHKFGNEPYRCHLRPYLLKTYEGRWYLFAQKNDEEAVKTFALDRFEDMELLPNEPFHIPADFDPSLYFAYTYGIYHRNGLPPLITIRAHGNARNYLRLSPLHTSQTEEPINADTSLFYLHCHTTPDLRLAILRHGHLVEVLSPADLRQQVADEVRLLAQSYGI